MEMGVSGNSDEGESLLTNEAALQRILAFESMIDITATQLIDIRGLGLNEFTLQEIRKLEGKLIRQFCQQLQTKFLVARNTSDNSFHEHPSLLKWLNVVGVSSVLAKALKMRCYSVEDLLALNDHQLQNIIVEMEGDAEDERKMISSLKQLRNYQNMLRQHKVQNIDTSNMYWDSWSKADDIFSSANSQSHDFNSNVKGDKEYMENGMHDQSAGTSRHGSESSDSNAFESQQKVHRTRSNTDPSNTELPPSFHELPTRQRSHQLPSTSSSCLTPPSPSCHGSKSSLESDSGMSSVARNTAPNASPPPLKSKIFVIPPSPLPMYTPPVTPGTPHKNSHFQVQTGSRSLTRERVSSTGTGSSSARSTKLTTGNLLPPFHSLKPSKSSEWHIGTRINKSVAHGDSISASNQSLASIASSTGHKHGKVRKEKKRPVNLVLTNESTIPNYIDMQRTANPRKNSITISPENNISNSASPLSPRTPMTPMTPYNPELRAIEQKINSLRTPSSPQTPKSSKMGTKIRDFFGMKKRKNKHKRQKSTEQLDKDDPPVSHFWPPTTPPHHHAPPRSVSSRQSNGSEENGMFSASYDYHPQSSSSNFDISSLSSTLPSSLVDTDRTIVADRRAEDSDGAGSRVHTITPDHPEVESDDGSTLVEKEADDVVSKPDIEDIKKNLFRQSSTIQSMSEEWDIPFSELQFGDSIGSGRVGTVYRGRWHGEVAIRVIDINHNDEEKLKAFKQEIMTYKKTRHENLELYMGSCMHPPHLTIVTGLCKGQSLYHHIRGRSVNINQAKIYGQHIVQGMGYLHSKGIIHKDLKSKNIFVKGKHVVITDFGVVGLHAVAGDKHSRPGSLSIPDGWLCHLAPEVIKALRIPQYEGDEVISTLPYTIQSDVFAFGTVWYELMSGSWPFNGLPAESIIWQVGSGKKQNLSQLQGGKDIKDILMQAWSFDPSRRPDFSDNGIMGILKRLQNHILRGNSDPAILTCGASLGISRSPQRRYHPLLSPTSKNKAFDISSVKF